MQVLSIIFSDLFKIEKASLYLLSEEDDKEKFYYMNKTRNIRLERNKEE